MAFKHVLQSIGLLICAGIFLGSVHFVLAEDDETVDPDALLEEITNRKTQIDQINKQIDSYRAKLGQYSSESANLMNDISMIENEIAIADLDVKVTQAQIETQQLEIQIVDENIRQESAKLETQKDMLGEMIFALHRKSDIGIIEVLFGADDFNALFTEVEQLENINGDLNIALDATHQTKENLEADRASQQGRLDDLLELESKMKEQIAKLELQQSAKDTLLAAAQDSEAQYRVLMSELRQERQAITNDLAALQSKVDEQLAHSDEAGGEPGVMSWPVVGGIITATFHDPSYPFRNLFPHSGLDIAVPTGTAVYSAAPGIVAWARTGNSYGNYIMVIHSGGYATLYAHLSRMDVGADQFVSRGEQIGLSGSTGLSTGPHLHFEVRLNGIPMNPQTYLLPR